MRISDWSSDVCSSDLDEEVRHCRATLLGDGGRRLLAALPRLRIDLGAGTDLLEALDHYELAGPEALLDDPAVASDVARLHRAQLDRPVGADDIELRAAGSVALHRLLRHPDSAGARRLLDDDAHVQAGQQGNGKAQG